MKVEKKKKEKEGSRLEKISVKKEKKRKDKKV